MLIQLTDITKTYGHGDATVIALNRIRMQISEGEFVAVMGPSGSGKSTCMNILGCLDAPTSGSYMFQGMEVTTLDQNQRALLRRNFLGFVFQGYNLLKRTTARENLELPLIYRGVPARERREKADHVLELVGLEDRGHHTSAELSGGQQQRVAIARAIITNPLLLLADEPTGNLDTQRSEEIMELLATLNAESGITIVMVTHEDDMASFAKRTITFRDGRIAEDTATSTSALLAEPAP